MYFSDNPSDRYYEKIMVGIPNFRPRGHGVVIIGSRLTEPLVIFRIQEGTATFREILTETTKLTDKTYYNKAFEVAAEYCALLCQEYNIAVDRIVGHCEAAQLGYGSNHADPEHWMKNFGETMIDFRKKVSSLLRNKDKESECVEKSTSNQVTIKQGDLVSIASNATYYNGATIPSWVKSQNWYVKNNPVSNRVVIDKNEKGTNSICSPIKSQFLSVVRKASGRVFQKTGRNKMLCNFM